jgi:hypothetical protein
MKTDVQKTKNMQIEIEDESLNIDKKNCVVMMKWKSFWSSEVRHLICWRSKWNVWHSEMKKSIEIVLASIYWSREREFLIIHVYIRSSLILIKVYQSDRNRDRIKLVIVIIIIIVSIIKFSDDRSNVNDQYDKFVLHWRHNFQWYVFQLSIIFEIKDRALIDVNYVRVDVVMINNILIEFVSKKRFRIVIDVVVNNVFNSILLVERTNNEEWFDVDRVL